MKRPCRCGCGRPARKLGLAQACYDRWRYHGRPEQVPPPSHAGNDRREAGRLEDYAELRGWGEPLERAAARLGVSVRTAWRYEARLREQVPA